MKLQSKSATRSLLVGMTFIGMQGLALAAGSTAQVSPFGAGATTSASSSKEAEAAAEVVEVTEPLKGCYRVISGDLTESSVDPKNVVGRYKFILQSDQAGKGKKRFNLSGPASGAEDSGESVRVARLKTTLEEEGPHGGHNFGTDKAVGTFSSDGDSIQINSVSCPNGDGVPRYIVGVETMRLKRGTGIFTNIQAGQIQFNLTYDACNNKNNPVAKLELISGQVCFSN